jgi:acyl-[acyl-carrier-protein]--UDP-N-acetylglucosamine O-acyltransferase
MSCKIHPSSYVDSTAELGEDVEIGPFAVVGPNVKIGDRSVLMPHCHIVTRTTIGSDTRIYTSAAIGGDPQDMKYKGEDTDLIIGNNSRIGEFTTVNRGTGVGGGKTVIGDNALIMAYVHVAHDCIIGDNVIITNSTQLAGHVVIEDHAWISGACLFHHFVTVGTMSFVAPASGVRVDIPPYTIADGFKENTRVRSLNLEGLRRKNVPNDSVEALKEAYRLLYRRNLTQLEAVAKVEEKGLAQDPYVKNLIEHIAASNAGFQSRALERYRTDKTRQFTTTRRIKEDE